MIRRRSLVGATSSLAVIAGLLVGVAPTAVAAQPAAAPVLTADELGAEAPRRGERVTDLRGGTCVSSLPNGIVRFDGPGGTRLVARVREQADTKLLSVLSGSGRIGEVKVEARDVSGQLAWRDGTMTGSVTIALPGHTSIARTMSQEVVVNAQPSGCDWAATVELTATGNGALIDLRGPLTASGGYFLRGAGVVTIGRTRVPVTGFLRATSPGPSASTSWRIAGSTKRPVVLPGARLEKVAVEIVPARRTPQGTATLVLEKPSLTAPAVLEIGGSDMWSARVDGASRPQWIVPGTDQVVVRTEDLTGSVGMRAGRPNWTLTAPGQTTIGPLNYTVDVGFRGSDTYTVQARSAEGTFLSLPGERAFTGVATQLTITPRGITGALSVATPGEELLDFPGTWDANNDYVLRPIPGEGWRFDASLVHTLRSGIGAIRFAGPVESDGEVDLTATGHIEIHDTRVPVRGYYKRVAWDAGTLPTWALAAYKEEVEGGRIPIGGGAGFVGGLIAWEGPGSQHHSTIGKRAPAASAAVQPRAYDLTVPPVTGSGTTTLQLSDADGETFYLPMSYTYTDADNWTATVSGTTPTNLYNPFDGLEVPETDFSGTITETKGVQTWDITIAMQQWQDMVKGVQFKGSFTVSNSCPLADQSNCPDSEGIFIGGDATLDFDDPSFPSATTTGAFLTDLSWGWWDGTAEGSITLAGITMANPDITVWRGTATGPNPDIVMPDLSSNNGNGLNVEFCANFTVPVPYVTTVDTLGCAAWSEDGSILAQVNTGGSISTSDYNGVNVTSTTLISYVYNGLAETETVFVDGVEIDADPNKNYVTADIVVPGNVMHDLGTGTSTAATIDATGWFDLDGNFEVVGTIPVNLSGGGFTLDEIVITMSRTKEDGLTDFDLVFDAECDVVINGNHFPLDVYIGYQKEGDSTITVGLNATGTQSTQPEGTMDFVNLVPTGDFEPENASIVDGSFDGKLPANVPNDGGFERSVNPGDVVVNGSFDDSMGLNVLTTGDFEEGTFTNILDNGDFEDSNFLVNGDFEENGGSTIGWSTTSGSFTTSVESGTASSSTGPTDQGDYVAVLNNNSTSSNTTGGLSQTIPVPLNHFGIEVSAWVQSNKSTSAAFHVAVASNGCSSADSFTSPTVTAVSGSWTEAVASGSLGNGCQSVTVTLVPEGSGTAVLIDAVEFSITSTYGGNTVPTVSRPNVVGTFESLATSPLMSGYSSGVSIATDYPDTLRSDGKQSWMTYSSTTGYTPGDFDVSYKVMFPTGSSDREIANFGFWLDGKYSSMNGYFFRLQTSNGDGGFFKRSNGSWSMVSGAQKVPDVTRGHWYQVRLTAVGGVVSAYVVDLTDSNDVVFSQTLGMPSVPGGVFGQVPDSTNSSTGIRWDDFAINSLQNMPGEQTIVKGPNQVWFADGAHAGNGRASLYTTSQGSMPFEYATGEAPAQGSYYTYSTWLRAASGTVSGTISLTALGGTTEAVSTSFSVGTSWTQVATTLAIDDGGHTDLRARITMTTTNAELQVDDQVLQQVPWYPNTAGGQASSVQVTTDEAHTGSSSLQITNLSNASSAIYSFEQLPLANSVFTVSAWVLSPGGASGQITIYEQAGTTSQKFTGTGTWQEVTVTRTMQGGSYLPAITIDVNSGFVGVPLYVDDVSLVVTHIDSTQGSYVGAPGSPGGWTSSVDVLPTTTLSMTPAQDSKASPNSSTTPSTPSNVQASISGSEVEVTWTASTSAYPIQKYRVYTTTGQSVCTVDWNEMTFMPPVTHCTFGMAAGIYQFQVQAYNGIEWSAASSASNSVAVYESIVPVVLSDSAVAHSGAGTLVLRPGAGGTQTDTYSVTPATAPAQGSTWQASVWLAPNTANNTQQPVTVTFTAGSNTKTTSVNLPSTKGSWTNTVVTLPIASAATGFSVAMSYTDSAGTNTVLVDDLSVTEINLTPVDDWQTYAPGGFVAVQGVDDSTNAHDGDGYLLVDNTGSQGAGVYLDDTYKATSGTAHEFSTWLRAPKASQPVSGSIWVRTFDSSGNTLDSYQSAVSVSNQWGYFFMSLPITKTNAVSIRTEIEIPADTTFYVDDLESRDVNYWSAVQPSSGVASVTIVDNSGQAANGQNYLRFITSGANGGMGDTITADTSGNPIDVIAGSSYKLEAYVRSTTGASVSGTMSLGAASGSTSTNSASVPFTATSSWTPVQLTLDTTKNANTLIPKIVLGSAGMLDVDELTLTPVLIEQSDPWSPTGSGVTWGVYDDPPNAYDSSYGVMEFSTSASGQGVKHAVSQSTTVGEQLSATAFVRTSGKNVNGTFQVAMTGGGQEVFKQGFTANGTWQMVSIPMTITQSGHTGLTVAVTLSTTGATLYLDQVAVQTNPWTPLTGATQAIVFDGASAQSGSGYLNLESTSGQNASTYLDMAASSDIGGTYAANSTWIATVYLRSTSDSELATGRLSLGPAGGTSTSQAFSVGSEWTAVPVSYTVGSTALSSLRIQATVDGSSVPLDIDSVSISDGTPPPDGITAPLPHPESGWIYLWDNAFDVPGLYLWAISAQVDFVDGDPGLGISATTYQDPTKMPHVMTGTDWMKGDMALNVSETDPCFLFDFESDGGNSGVSLGAGVFTANDFSINFAPRGCQVGPYTLAKGASLSFDGELGDGQVSFDIAITEGDDGPEFTEDIGITDITIGGFDFKEMDLSIYLTATDDSITFVGDMVLPMGTFNGSYDLDASEQGLVMDGSVDLTDWDWAGGTFDVEEFDFSMSMTVPFGAGECGSFSEDASGLMSMAKKTSLSFTGDIAMNCGKLETLEMDYEYHHGSITEVFELDYSASTGILSGEVSFDFDRSTSWKFFFHRYNRHPKFSITLAYSMDVDKPTTASVTLTGSISVSGGDGSISCTLETGSGSDWADDQCSLHVHISIFGGHTYDASW